MWYPELVLSCSNVFAWDLLRANVGEGRGYEYFGNGHVATMGRRVDLREQQGMICRLMSFLTILRNLDDWKDSPLTKTRDCADLREV